MLEKIKLSIIKTLTYLKYRSVKFHKVGVDCVYKSLSTSFISPQNISIGDYSQVGPRSLIDGTGGVSLGVGCILAPEVIIYSRTHNFNKNISALPFDDVSILGAVIIKDYVWIGSRAIILPGVTVDEGAVVGAGAVVSKNVPRGAVVVGNPAEVVKFRNMEIFEKLVNEKVPFVYKKYGRKKRFVRAVD